MTRMIALSQRLSKSHELFFWAPETVAPIVSHVFPESRVLPLPLLRIDSNLDRYFNRFEEMMEEGRKPAPEGYCFHDESRRAASLVHRFFSTRGLPLAHKA